MLAEHQFAWNVPPVSWAAAEELAARGKAATEALIEGLAHQDAKVRATCALLLDHVADDRCIEPLLNAMRHDPHEAVRRCAMHAVVCDGCKECSLNTDVVGALIDSVQTDRSRAVRRRAVFYLSQQRSDARTGPALEALLTGEADKIIRHRRGERWQDWPPGVANNAGMTQEAVTTQQEKTQDSRQSGQARLGALDVCRGLAILVVLFIHVSGHFLPVLHPAKSPAPPTWAWYALAALNQDGQWAVPCFLMLSAFVNALSLARGNAVGRYAKRRVLAALVPYVLWSGVYVVVDSLLSHRPFPGPVHIAKLLLTGTAHFHLYFFVLVLEMYVLLPLLVPLFQKRPPFWAVALGAVVLQALVYGLNRYVFLHRFQTTIFWDILPVALGLWLFSQSTRGPEILRRGIWGAGVVTLAALIIYTPLAVATMLPHAHINTAEYQFGEWGYTAGMSFLMLALAGTLARGWLTTLLGYLGAESLAIYVMHPLAILALDKFGLNRSLSVSSGMVIYYAACLALPLGAAWAWKQGKNAMAGK